ncbi:hypothetical protein FACS189485_01880 [Spirochaetia bacterium]|nr:hypothetical protein FACS189485_01880 [Spirochaetia bacterium]
MKLLSEKLKSQINEAKSIAEKENAEAQAIAGAEDVDPGKAIAAIEKAQGKAKAAELVIKNLEPKLAAALKEEARAVHDEKQEAAVKAFKTYIAALEPEYAKLKQACKLWVEANEKLEALRDELMPKIGPAYEYGQPHGAALQNITENPNIQAMINNTPRFGRGQGEKKIQNLWGQIDKMMDLKKEDHVIPGLRRYFDPFEKTPQPAPEAPEPEPIVYKPQVRDLGAVAYSN